jgi:DNA-binding SARP family transcriptional activator
MRGFDLTCNGRHVPLPHSVQRLIAFLALHERPVLRRYAAETLYIDSSEGRVSGNLRTALWRLRRPGYELVELHGEHMTISSGLVVDVHRLAATCQRLVREEYALDSQELAELTAGGELLPGWYEDWVTMERERTRQLWLQALEAASEQLTDAGRHAEAVVAGLAAAESEPLRETAHMAVIKAHLAGGNCGEALRQYQRYAAVLDRELQLLPSPEMQALTAPLRQVEQTALITGR